jgi:hypothetical protein
MLRRPKARKPSCPPCFIHNLELESPKPLQQWTIVGCSCSSASGSVVKPLRQLLLGIPIHSHWGHLESTIHRPIHSRSRSGVHHPQHDLLPYSHVVLYYTLSVRVVCVRDRANDFLSYSLIWSEWFPSCTVWPSRHTTQLHRAGVR